MIAAFNGAHRFLSNYYPSPIVFDGVLYATVEHAYAAGKTLDPGERQRISVAATPGDAKRLGRRVMLRHDWEEYKIPFMESLLRAKFRYPHLADMLRKTGDTYLQEGNTWNDTFWGVCRGIGTNHLGHALMRVRGSL